jgi:hypothetical protein
LSRIKPTLVPDDLCGLLCQRLMLALGFLDCLLDLHLRSAYSSTFELNSAMRYFHA